MLSAMKNLLGVPFAVLALSCDDAPGVPDDLEQACRQLVACESDAPITRARLDGCRQSLEQAYDEAAEIGCADAYADVVSCYAIVPLVCSMQGPGSCEEVLAEVERCRQEAGL
jgi:hypothetical protein